MLPAGRPLYFAPCACAASSMTIRFSVGRSQNRVHVRRLSVEMDREDDLCPRCDPRLDACGIHREGARIDVRKHRFGAGIQNGRHVSHKGKGQRDDFIPGADPAASNARCRALVPELARYISDVPEYVANSCSNWETSLPRQIDNSQHSSESAASTSGLMLGTVLSNPDRAL